MTMLLFDLVITLIESLILACLIIFTFDLEKHKLAFVFLTLVYTIETTFFNSIYINNFILFFVELITTLCFLYYYKKNIKFSYILVPILGIILITIAVVIAIFVTSFILNSPVTTIATSSLFYLTAASLSKIINLIFDIFAIKFLKRNSNNLLFSNWWLILLFLALNLISLVILVQSTVLDKYNSNMILSIIVINLSLLILSVIIYYKINNENKKQLELTKALTKHEYMNKNYQIMNYIYNKTLKDQHQMTYLMMNFKNLVIENRYDDLLDSINQEINKSNKLIPIKSTSNPFFDFMLREKLDELSNTRFNIKTVIQIDKSNSLDDQVTVTTIINAIDWLINYTDNDKYFTITVTQINRYILVKLSISTHLKDIPKTFVTNDKNIQTKLMLENNKLELRLLISLND